MFTDKWHHYFLVQCTCKSEFKMHIFFPQTAGVSMCSPKLCQVRNPMQPNLTSFGGSFDLAFQGKWKMQRVSAFCLLRWRKRVWMLWRKLRRWTQIFWRETFLASEESTLCTFVSVHGHQLWFQKFHSYNAECIWTRSIDSEIQVVPKLSLQGWTPFTVNIYFCRIHLPRKWGIFFLEIHWSY